MTLFIAIGSLIFGLLLLVKGADWLVQGAVSLARRWGVSELAIGLTVVAFGTSIPELTVNIFSSLQGANDIAIGSNIANILLILGIAAIIAPMTVQVSTTWKEIPFSLLAAVLLIVMANDHIIDGYPVAELSRSDGLALIAFFIIFLWYIFGLAKPDLEDEHLTPGKLSRALGETILGLILLVGGGKIAVDGAVSIATGLGISEALVGLTIVAVGTSLPELVTSVVAARRGKADIAVGNIVGSNIFNIFWILGLSAVIKPLAFAPALNVDLFIVILTTIILFIAVHTGHLGRRLLFWKQRHGHIIERGEGVCMLVCYAVYLGFLIWRG